LQIENGKFFRHIKLLRQCSKILFQLLPPWRNFQPINDAIHGDLTTKAVNLRKDLSW